jgi:UDP-N-acetylglucosamine 4,6-dehydratase|tara:strand:- start:67 stop:1080 length:1014 start_codon:yes stop_codon:yes gene_type:complete
MNEINNSTLLITGGTGSFGNEVLKSFLKTKVKEIRVFSRDEKKQDDMRKEYGDDRLQFYIGDVRDSSSIRSAIHDVDFVFHAAALKQVPSCEFHPIEAVKTNILGTENILNASIDAKVKKVVCLSTDKAVYPINAMGLSKSLMEKVLIAKSREGGTKTIICGTRYGNVMGSRGSVIPLFLDQVRDSKPLTITNPDMTRFIMSLKDAVDLVVYAFLHGNPGDIFVQKSPASSIGDLLEAVRIITNSPDHKIDVIGTRHGEKLYESLISSEEMMMTEDLGDFFRIKPDNRDLNYSKYYDDGNKELEGLSEYNSDNTERLDIVSLVKLLRKEGFDNISAS